MNLVIYILLHTCNCFKCDLESYSIFQIGTTDKDHGHCLLWGDPHFTGFDYKK